MTRFKNTIKDPIFGSLWFISRKSGSTKFCSFWHPNCTKKKLKKGVSNEPFSRKNGNRQADRLMVWQRNNGKTMWPPAMRWSKKPNRNQKVLNSKKTKSSYPTSLYAWRYCTTSRYLVWRVFVFLIFPPASSASSGFLLKQMSAGEVKFTISLNIKSKKLKTVTWS